MSGNNELNQLQQQRQDLIEERERLEADLPRLENALEQAPTGWHLAGAAAPGYLPGAQRMADLA
ncbi:hypothetical protein ACLBWA_31285, partial [Pseudomonas aeruginosa]